MCMYKRIHIYIYICMCGVCRGVVCTSSCKTSRFIERNCRYMSAQYVIYDPILAVTRGVVSSRCFRVHFIIMIIIITAYTTSERYNMKTCVVMHDESVKKKIVLEKCSMIFGKTSKIIILVTYVQTPSNIRGHRLCIYDTSKWQLIRK